MASGSLRSSFRSGCIAMAMSSTLSIRASVPSTVMSGLMNETWKNPRRRIKLANVKDTVAVASVVYDLLNDGITSLFYALGVEYCDVSLPLAGLD
jgi:hypothetical protein